MVRLGIVIPALDAAGTIGKTLESLGEAEDAGLAAERLVVDGGSRDATPECAGEGGARMIAARPGRGSQLAAGAAAVSGEWLLFLHADTRLERGWAVSVAAFIADPANRRRAAVFRFALDDASGAARRLERLVAWRCRILALPYGDQGLLIERGFYGDLGGFRDLPLMEDVDLVRRIGRRHLVFLPVRAVTSAARYRRDGWLRRSLRNLVCLALYFLGLPPRVIRRLYA